jgi:O-antigen biosynthesis protein
VLEQRDPTPTGAGSGVELDQAAWLSPSALALIGRFGGGESPTASVAKDGTKAMAKSGRFPLATPPNDGGAREALVIVTMPALEEELRRGGSLELAAGGTTLTLQPWNVDQLGTDLELVVRGTFISLEAPQREQVSQFLASTLASVPDDERRALATRLLAVREALREHGAAAAEPRSGGMHVDRILAVDEGAFYFEGWLHDEEKEAIRVTAISPEGLRAELLDRMFRGPRPDVAAVLSDGKRSRSNHGFLCFAELSAPSVLGEGWLFELETAAGSVTQITGPPVITDTLAVRDAILQDPFFERLPNDQMMSEHVHPAISRIQEAIGMSFEFEDVVQFGTPPPSPEVSIVVPLYERLDHLEMQLAEFVHDPEISRADLVYVLDSPAQSDELLELAAQLTPLYNVPFRVGILKRNVGFAGASNAGASLAQGRLLLLLNSDILPDRPGWLSRLQQFYDSKPEIGALGPKLLYEDDSIQHAGMYYHRYPGSSLWVDAQYYKGMHRSLPAANVARPVPLVSGACLMIARSLYEELGGLHGIYARGDYEDMELCLELLERGRENWYLPEVELYHLEGQSYVWSIRRTASRYNVWLHSHIWGERIAKLMGDSG